jgi:DNA replication protein DnaC
MLVLDDYGKQHDTTWSRATLFEITNQSLDARLPTVVTTNLSLDDLVAYDERLWERVIDQTKTETILFPERNPDTVRLRP